MISIGKLKNLARLFLLEIYVNHYKANKSLAGVEGLKPSRMV